VSLFERLETGTEIKAQALSVCHAEVRVAPFKGQRIVPFLHLRKVESQIKLSECSLYIT
jgi:hypothetical protein